MSKKRVKSKATLSIPSRTWEQAKRTYPNASERVTELLEADLDVSQAEDEELIKQKIQEMEEEKESIESDIADLEEELQGVESELSAARSTLERLQREEEEEKDDLEWAIKKIKRADFSDKSLRYCSNELDMAQDKLEEKARNSDIEPEEQVKQV
jgi:chromosome segregation protein